MMRPTTAKSRFVRSRLLTTSPILQLILAFGVLVAFARAIGGAQSMDHTGWSLADALAEQQLRLERLVQRLRRGGSAEQGDVSQPPFAGTWKTHKSVNLDEFLDRAMGVGYLKRQIASKASQTQRLHRTGDIVHLEISDRRGTARYILKPDGKTHSGFGFMKLPIKQKAKWSRDGKALEVEERYSQHLGGEEHGEPCKGDSCPVVRSRRSVDDKTGMMVMEIERTILTGETIRTKTFYAPVDDK